MMGFALAGGLAGLGRGLVDEANRRRDEAMERFRMELRKQERAEDKKVRADERAEDRKWREDDRAEDKAHQIRMEGIRQSGADRRAASRGLRRPSRGFDPDNLSAGLLKRLDEHVGEDASQAIILSEEVSRLMEERGISEQQAERIAKRGMVYEEDVTVDPPGLMNKHTEKQTNREGRGIWTGRFDYGDGTSGGEEGAGPSTTERAAEPSVAKPPRADAMPMPASREELQTGGLYRHPRTGEILRWNGQKFVVME